MDELIGRLVANIGIDQAAAQKAVGIILQFLVKEGPAEKVQGLLAKLPGAQEAIAAAPPDEVRLSSHWPRICSSYRPAFLRDVGNTVGTDLRG